MGLSRQDEITRRVIEKQGGLSHVRKTASSSEVEIEKTFNADGTEVELSDQESTDNVNKNKPLSILEAQKILDGTADIKLVDQKTFDQYQENLVRFRNLHNGQ